MHIEILLGGEALNANAVILKTLRNITLDHHLVS